MTDGFTLLAGSPLAIALMLLAIPIGMAFGAVPGLGGKIALLSAIPFLPGLDVTAGAVFLISLHAVVHTGAAAPTILLGIPGTGPSTAVVADGNGMARNGEAMRAIGAAAMASAVGGLAGAIFLALIVPFTLTLMKAVSYPEIFLLCLFGLSLSAVLSDGAMIKGLMTASLGLVLSFVGIDDTYGTVRLSMGAELLFDGMDLVVAILALYAVPEIMALGLKGIPCGATAEASSENRQLWTGARDVLRHRWLTLRTSLFGTLLGVVPGLGGDVAAWICYGHAIQSSKTPEKFGRGAVEGVIGPEAANNSKEGGALLPTLFLGIPGSSGMAILLVALVPLGIAPGPHLLVRHPDLVWAMIWALAIANVLGAILLMLLARPLNRVSQIDPVLTVPLVLILALTSAYVSSHEWKFLIVMGGMSAIGYAFMKQNWPRAPFVIGLILGPEIESSLIKSLSLWGPDFLLRPTALVLFAVLLFSGWRMSRRLAQRSKAQKNAQ